MKEFRVTCAIYVTLFNPPMIDEFYFIIFVEH
jgi:hypothetical protein